MRPLVFVHGFMGGSGQWQGQIEGMPQFEVIALDLPGFGERANLEALASIPGYADWALEELARRGIDRFHLVGHSMGGMIVQEMARRAPQRIDRLVLYGTGATGVLPGRFESIPVSKSRAHSEGPRTTARRIAATWFREGEKALAYEGCAEIAEKCSLSAMLAGLDAMEAWNGEQSLPSIEAPTLVLWGDSDRTYPWAQTSQLWHSIPETSLCVLPHCAHAAHLEKPLLFNAILSDFLTG